MELVELKKEREFVENGNLRDSEGQYGDAIAAYDSALGIDPTDADALFNKAFVGIQPQVRQIPPSSAYSTTPTLKPNCEARIAAT